MTVALFDYGAGNLHSLQKALEAGGASVRITDTWQQALALDALVLPGVGSFGAAAARLHQDRQRLREALEGGLPTLGICLGMQLLFDESEEGGGRGIGFFSGSVRALRSRTIPQMGWNDVSTTNDPLFDGVGGLVAYYANSYVCAPKDESAVIATSDYQGDLFPAAVRRARVWGVQFHPEKSSTPGLRIIRNFLARAREDAP